MPVADKGAKIISIAPMLGITHVHFRYLMRLLSKKSTLYTEMVSSRGILKRKYAAPEVLKYDPVEHPVVVQFRGSEPKGMAKCTEIAASLGYDEVNINCGCPKPKAKEQEAFGAELMKHPELVLSVVTAMVKASSVPVTVKCRIGVDDYESYEYLKSFIHTVSTGGIRHFIVHARKALLKGLNPLENRLVPPLNYDWVYRLAKDFPHLLFSINGGIRTIESVF